MNKHVLSLPGCDVAVCDEKVRNWRKMGSNVKLLDLRKAYLQIHVAPELVGFQGVRYGGKSYVMTRMGFGLSVAPKIMTAIVRKVLLLDPLVGQGTDSYIDDICVNESIVSVERVRDHLHRFGLQTKAPVALSDARVLGLRVVRDSGGAFSWKRDSELPVCPSAGSLTKRLVFSICGKLTGHYPVAGWLRVACSFVKRLACDGSWD